MLLKLRGSDKAVATSLNPRPTAILPYSDSSEGSSKAESDESPVPNKALLSPAEEIEDIKRSLMLETGNKWRKLLEPHVRASVLIGIGESFVLIRSRSRPHHLFFHYRIERSAATDSE